MKNQSHTGLVIELKTEHGNMMAHAILFKRNVRKDIGYLHTLISYMYYVPIVKGAACYSENYTFKQGFRIKLVISVNVTPTDTHFTTAYYKEALV